jgi:hypothetical protein
MSGRLVFEAPKRGGSCLRVMVSEYRGSRFLDMREWVERGGELAATRKGATMPLDTMQALGEALIAASHAERASGRPSGS